MHQNLQIFGKCHYLEESGKPYAVIQNHFKRWEVFHNNAFLYETQTEEEAFVSIQWHKLITEPVEKLDMGEKLIKRDEKNDPIVCLGGQIELKRHDNTLVIADQLIAEVADEHENGAVMGTADGALYFLVYTNEGKKTAYTLQPKDILQAVIECHQQHEGIPRRVYMGVEPVDLELMQEPTPEQIAEAEAEIPPSLIEASNDNH